MKISDWALQCAAIELAQSTQEEWGTLAPTYRASVTNQARAILEAAFPDREHNAVYDGWRCGLCGKRIVTQRVGSNSERWVHA